MWLLLAPIRLNVDSSKNKYLIIWSGLGSLTLIPAKEEWFLNLKIGFWKKKFFLSGILEKMMKRKKKELKPNGKKKRKKYGFLNSLKKVQQVLKTFEIKICKIDFDTDDYYWNALLIPALQMVNKGSRYRVAINFEGKNNILLNIENRPIKIIYSILIKK
jgi:hypothetical protein